MRPGPAGRNPKAEPPSAAEIAGSRPGGRADFLRAQEVGGRRALKGGFKRPARATPGARAQRPRRPFGTHFEPPTAESFVRKRGAKLAPLENPPSAHVHLAAGRRLVPTRPSAGDSFTLASDRDTRFIKRIHSSVKFVQQIGIKAVVVLIGGMLYTNKVLFRFSYSIR